MGLNDNNQFILKVSGLKTHFFTSEGVAKAVDGVDFKVKKGEVLGLVGESGCGKSVTALSIMQLVASPPGKIVGGKVEFMGEDLLGLNFQKTRKLRGQKISMIFQDPLTSLNPVLKVGYQLSEVFHYHKGFNWKQSLEESARMLKVTDMPSPEERVKNFPHEMSGGMRQRAMIAMALSCEPDLLIADEPSTALDVTVQAQVLKLMKTLCRERETAVLLITHDMGVVANMCNRVAVMYAGRIVESTDIFTLFKNPAHPYTRGLLRSLPRLGAKRDRLDSIEGQPPQLNRLPAGCAFEPRCEYAKQRCKQEPPGITHLRGEHDVRCYYPIQGANNE
ncbi:MAG: ABC transporter ATP-binding protein [Deltaproteobacteria bacterium]|nr:ABC transporter ATP-binding protein [Deltaproteobacteria bacterium]MBW2153329.1 ABC transporter ATP-binding protein [Deltaproteobacteria bacterium]